MCKTSVIIRTFNEAEYIADTLEAVSEQSYDDFELLVIDSGSTDGTVEIAETYADDIVFIDPDRFTFGYSLNVGCEAASGDFVTFLSGHAVPTDREWLEPLVKQIQDDDVAMAYSNQTGVEQSKYSECRLFGDLFPDERKYQTPPDYFANNASSIIKRDLWERHQFDESLPGHEDIEWAKHFMDRGYHVVYEPESCIYHIHDEEWDEIYTRFRREAVADRKIGVRDPQDWWREYAAIPKDILRDVFGAALDGQLTFDALQNITNFVYHHRVGTASGLRSGKAQQSE